MDTYTREVLITQYALHKTYVMNRSASSVRLCFKWRSLGIPEDISENMIKFILHDNGYTNVCWDKTKPGDLWAGNHMLECKCFTSNAPISFTPSSNWHEIYFLDARD